MKGKDLRDQGMDLVKKNNRTWHDNAVLTVIRNYQAWSRKHPEVTGEDLKRLVMPQVGIPKHHNAWGPMIKALSTRKIINYTGRHVLAQRPSAHAREVRLYRWRKA